MFVKIPPYLVLMPQFCPCPGLENVGAHIGQREKVILRDPTLMQPAEYLAQISVKVLYMKILIYQPSLWWGKLSFVQSQ